MVTVINDQELLEPFKTRPCAAAIKGVASPLDPMCTVEVVSSNPYGVHVHALVPSAADLCCRNAANPPNLPTHHHQRSLSVAGRHADVIIFPQHPVLILESPSHLSVAPTAPYYILIDLPTLSLTFLLVLHSACSRRYRFTCSCSRLDAPGLCA